jgi:putative endonuclease
MWSVYVLQSSQDGKRYIGISSDVQRRITEHNAGRTRSTKGHRPFELIYKESFTTRSEARERELYFKTAAGRRFLDKTQTNRSEGVKSAGVDQLVTRLTER